MPVKRVSLALTVSEISANVTVIPARMEAAARNWGKITNAHVLQDMMVSTVSTVS